MPSLYEATLPVGDVSSSNFTTLYNASGLAVPNAGAGSVTGNLNVGGNLTVQGTSLLIGSVALQSTLSLPNYTFPLPDGTSDQVMVTDGSGNVYWSNVQALPGANYTIQADATTGGADLTLVSGAGGSDSVKFAEGTGINIARTDASTITISTPYNGDVVGPSSSTDNAAAKYDSTTGKLIQNSSLIIDDLSGNIQNISGGTGNYLTLTTDASEPIKIIRSTTSTNQSVRGLTLKADSTGTPAVGFGTSLDFEIETAPGNIERAGFIAVQSTDLTSGSEDFGMYFGLMQNGTTYTTKMGITSNGNVQIDGDLEVDGGDITTLPGGIANLYNNNAVDTINIGNSVVTEVNIGNITGSRVQIKSPTIVGANTTQAVFNTVATTVNAFGASTATNIGAATGTTTIGNDLYVNGQVLKINADNTAADSYLYLKDTSEYLKWDNTNTRFELSDNVLATGWLGADADVIYINYDDTAIDSYLSFKGINNEYIKWNNTDTRFEFSDQIYNSQTDTPAIFEKRNVTADINTPYESKPAIKLIQRVTDAADNNTVIAGPAVLFSRTSGATATTEQTFANFGATWDGTIAPVNATALTSANNGTIYQITSVGSTDFTLIGASANTVGTYFKKSGATGTGSGTAKEYDVNITFSWSPDNFAEPTPGNFSNSPLLLNLSGNDAFFQNNSLYIDYTTSGLGKVGINKSNPSYALDVTGEIRATSNIRSNDSFYSDGDTFYLNNDKTNTNVNINFGRVAPNNNAVIRWNSSTNTFEWSEDGSTWHQFIDATLTAPFYNGQMLSYRYNASSVGEWINDNKVTTTDANERNVFSYRPLSPVAGVNSVLYIRKDYSDAGPEVPGTGTYADGAGASLSFQVVSDTQTPPGGSVGQANAFANVTGVYSSTVPTVSLRTSINNGSSYTTVGDFTTAGATLPNDLAVNGGDITTTVTGTASLFNTNATTLNIGGAATTVNIGLYDPVNTVNVPSLTVNALATIRSNTATVSSTSQFTLDTTTRTSLKVMVDVVDNVTGEVQVLEILAIKKGTTAYVTTYAEMYSASALANFTADVSGGSLRIRVTPISANSTTFNFVRTSLD